MSLFVEAADHAAAENIVDQACKKLLCNEIMEYFTFTVLEA
jgi:phosphoribosylformylglycinamidine (FGAM) synthase PurS component